MNADTAKSDTALTDLERHEAELAAVQLTDFRAANLFAWVADHIPAGASVLDVGCGASGLVAWLNEAGVDARGVDTSEATIRVARQFFSNRGIDPTRVFVGDTADLVAQGEQVDVVTCMDVIEHVEDDQKLFDELVQLVRPGGLLIITVPALMALFGERDVKMGHFRRYERAELAALADRPDLDVQTLRFWNVLGIAPTWIAEKVLKRSVNEGFRFGKPTLRTRVMRKVLTTWFGQVENRITPPVGMTLLLVARRR